MDMNCAGATCALLLSVVVAAVPAQNAPAPSGQPSVGRAVRAADDLRIEPKKGQSEEQLWADRYACHNWAMSQSGFDPARANASAADETPALREQYRRAMVACLEAHGYSAHYGAATPAPAAAPAAAPTAPPPQLPPARHDAKYSQLPYHPLVMQIDAGYTLTRGAAEPTLEGGGAVGLGLTWFPSSALPLGLRVDASYSTFNETQRSLTAASLATGRNVASGYQNLYGGDADLQLDLAHGSSRVKMYLFGGAGWYRQQTVFQQLTFENGLICFFDCFPGRFAVLSTIERSTSSWLKSWNAGLGLEIALTDPASFFIEARYLRIAPYSSDQVFIPIRMGFRF